MNKKEYIDIYDFGGEFAQTYTETCAKCGYEIQVSTQKDECPEYYTDIFVKCRCGGRAHFKLPVN